MGPVKHVLVRRNCEYTLLLDVGPGEAEEALLARAEAVPMEDWSTSWSPMEVDTESEAADE